MRVSFDPTSHGQRIVVDFECGNHFALSQSHPADGTRYASYLSEPSLELNGSYVSVTGIIATCKANTVPIAKTASGTAPFHEEGSVIPSALGILKLPKL